MLNVLNMRMCFNALLMYILVGLRPGFDMISMWCWCNFDVIFDVFSDVFVHVFLDAFWVFFWGGEPKPDPPIHKFHIKKARFFQLQGSPPCPEHGVLRDCLRLPVSPATPSIGLTPHFNTTPLAIAPSVTWISTGTEGAEIFLIFLYFLFTMFYYFLPFCTIFY